MTGFRSDLEQLCLKYGGLHGVLEIWTDWELEIARNLIAAGKQDQAVFYLQFAQKLLELRDFWVYGASVCPKEEK